MSINIPRPLPPSPKYRGKGPVSEWYQGRSILITGASGFMGKVLLEKLLYQCNGLKCIYVLLRSKRGKSPEQRLEEMWKIPAFQRLRNEDPSAFKKVIPVHGDVLTERLGLSKEARQEIIDNVTVVFHSAATLKLEAKLKDALEMNTAGTERVLDLAKEIKNLKVFVHLSTAFCSADIAEFKEKVYPTNENAREILQVSRWLNEEALDKITATIIKPHPNTYTYSKRLAENLVADEYSNLPVVIVRPSIVTPAGVEPLPGWVDSLNGPMGLLVAAGKGVLRSMHVKGENHAQVVPVDMAISALIIIAWKMGSANVKPAEIPVYNLTNDEVKPMTWGEVLDTGRAVAYDYPFEGQIWYPDGDMRSSKLMHRICCIFMHWIPAILIDFLMLIFMQKRFMLRIARKIDDGLELLQFFTTRNWYFESKNFLALPNDLTSMEKEIFQINFDAMSITDYYTLCILGARQYIMKEDLSTIPRCRRVQAVLYVINKIFSIGFYVGLIWIMCCCSDTVSNFFEYVGLCFKNVPIIGSLIPYSD